MLKLATLGLSGLLAGTAAGCAVHEAPYSYGAPVPVAQAAYSYPLYYADGAYWAYQHNSWYWWANDHWLASSYAPHRPMLVHAGGYQRPGHVRHGGSHPVSHSVHRGGHGGHHSGHRSGHH